MGKLRTSAIFYRRGVPVSAFLFGIAVQPNYTMVSTQYMNPNSNIYRQTIPRPKVMSFHK